MEKITSLARDKIAQELNLIDNNIFAFCWIVDYPMFEKDEKTKKIIFSHNPFSMPQGDIKKIADILSIILKLFIISKKLV